MIFSLIFFIFLTYFSPSLSIQTTELSIKRLKLLWKNAETKSLITAAEAMQELFQYEYDTKESIRFQQINQRVGMLLMNELSQAENLSNNKQFYEASLIYRVILDKMSNMLGEHLIYCQNQLVETVYRLCLGGHAEWSELATILSSISQRNDYQNFLLDMAQINTEQKLANWKPKRNTIRQADDLPYVLRFHLPQKYHTPTLAHFGHVSD